MTEVPLQSPLLSIVVPTRNRACYAASAIRALLRIHSDAFELVVQDNSDNDDLKESLGGAIADPRLRYAHNPEPCGQVDNFDNALGCARGEYVTMLGDDDGINTELLTAVRWARDQQLDALLSSRPAQYWWPDIRFRYGGDLAAGTLDLALFTGEIAWLDATEALHECLAVAGSSLGNLPRTYYGIVKKSCLDQLHQETGRYCFVSPDMSSAVGLVKHVRRMAKIDYPLFLPGSSAKSGAGMGARKQHVGRLEDQPHLAAKCIENWSDVVPKFFSANTIWAEACVQTLCATHQEQLLRRFNFAELHASCLVFNPGWYQLALASYYRQLSKNGDNRIWGTCKLFGAYVRLWGERGKSLARNFSKFSGVSATMQTWSGIDDIEAAMIRLEQELTARGVSIDTFLKTDDADIATQKSQAA